MMKRLAIGLIRAYQKIISPHLGDCCRYHPSCSEYAKESIENVGFIKGSALTIKRICKCHPFSKGGVDLPPGQKSK